MTTRYAHLNKFLAVLVLLPAFSACSHINVQQITYEVLRQEDCRRNKLESFCARNFSKEYLEYARLRKDFIRSQEQQTWRVNRDAFKLAGDSVIN